MSKIIISWFINAKNGFVIYAEIMIIATFIKLFDTKIVARRVSGLLMSFKIVLDKDVFEREIFLLSFGDNPKNATSLPETIADININNINTENPIRMDISKDALLTLFKNTKYLKDSDSKFVEIKIKTANRHLYHRHYCRHFDL